MKTNKKIWVLLGITLLIMNISSAQNAELIETLNIEQIKLLDKSMKVIQKNREAFKTLLNDEQKAILKNKSTPRKERMTQLKAALNPNQLSVYEANRAEAKESRIAFRKSLSKEQRDKIKLARENGTHKPNNRAEKKLLMEKIAARKMALGITE